MSEEHDVAPEDREDGELEDGEWDGEDAGGGDQRPRTTSEADSNQGEEKSDSEGSDKEGKKDGDEENKEGGEDHKKHRHRRHKKEKRKRKRDHKDKKHKSKKPRYIDHDNVAEVAQPKWEGGYNKAKPQGESYNNTERSPPGPYDSPYVSPGGNQTQGPQPGDRSPPGPYDSPYESPPGPYDSPSDDEDHTGPGNRRGRGGRNRQGSGSITMLGMIGDEYMEDDNNERGRNRQGGNRQRRNNDKKFFKERQREREREHGGRKRLNELRMDERPMCKFYMEGKCAKGMNCQFNHDFTPPQKREVCKFYLNSYCQKGDNCVFMHGEFPCKYYHTGQKCYSGDNCKFSHAELDEEGRIIIDKIVHEGYNVEDDFSSPKKKPREVDPEELEKIKKIPSLFDIQVFPPGQRPPLQMQNDGNLNRPNFYNEMNNGGKMSVNNQPGILGPPPGMLGPGPNGPMNMMMGGPPMFPNNSQQFQQQTATSPSNHEDEDNQGGLGSSQGSQGMKELAQERLGNNEDSQQSQDGGSGSETGGVISRLPPKQRELFLRIQAQQKQNLPEQQQENAENPMLEDDNWYSSDEEEGEGKSEKPKNKIADLLKTLSQQGSNPLSTAGGMMPSSMQNPMPNMSQMSSGGMMGGPNSGQMSMAGMRMQGPNMMGPQMMGGSGPMGPNMGGPGPNNMGGQGMGPNNMGGPGMGPGGSNNMGGPNMGGPGMGPNMGGPNMGGPGMGPNSMGIPSLMGPGPNMNGPNMGPGGPNMAPGMGGPGMGPMMRGMFGPNMGPGNMNMGPGNMNMGPGNMNMGPGNMGPGFGAPQQAPGPRIDINAMLTAIRNAATTNQSEQSSRDPRDPRQGNNSSKALDPRDPRARGDPRSSDAKPEPRPAPRQPLGPLPYPAPIMDNNTVIINSRGTAGTFPYLLRTVTVDPTAKLLAPDTNWREKRFNGDPRVKIQLEKNPLLKNLPMMSPSAGGMSPKTDLRSSRPSGMPVLQREDIHQWSPRDEGSPSYQPPRPQNSYPDPRMQGQSDWSKHNPRGSPNYDPRNDRGGNPRHNRSGDPRHDRGDHRHERSDHRNDPRNDRADPRGERVSRFSNNKLDSQPSLTKIAPIQLPISSPSHVPHTLLSPEGKQHNLPELPPLSHSDHSQSKLVLEVPKPVDIPKLDIKLATGITDIRHNAQQSPDSHTSRRNSSNKSDGGDSPTETRNYRNDPRFKKKLRSDRNSGDQSPRGVKSPEQPADMSPPAGTTVANPRGSLHIQRKANMDYTSPLEAAKDIHTKDSYSSYNRPPNRLPQRNPPNKPTGSEQSKLAVTTGSEVATTASSPTSMSCALPVLPEAMDMPPIPEVPDVPLKDVFKTIDPTASPFC